MSLPFEGRVALVTGASSGIGRATAVALAAAGADVALNFFSLAESAGEAAKEIRAMGRKVILYHADISNHDTVEKMVLDIEKQLGGLDLFVSSAVYSDREPFTSANLTGFQKTLDVTMMGAYYSLRAASNAMIRRGRGSAVIVSSPHAEIAFPNCMAYNMAKAANDQMMRTAATELLKHRICVNAVYPGWTDTPGERKFISDEALAEAAKKQPLGRLAKAEEIARAILFLLDPASSFITGTILHIDGGLFLPWWSNRGEDAGF